MEVAIKNFNVVFQALGVSRLEDMELLKQTMEPYIVCVTCQPLLEAVHPLSPPAVSPPLVIIVYTMLFVLFIYN